MIRLLPALFLLSGCNGCAHGHALPPSVLVLVLDGVRTDEFTSTTVSDLTGVTGEAYAAHTWKDVVGDGTVVRAAQNTGVTITGPAHAALLTGHPEVFANFPLDAERGPGAYRPLTPTLFEAARKGLDLPENRVLFIANNDFLAGVTSSMYPGFGDGAEWDEVMDVEAGRPVDDDEPVLEELEARIDADAPRLTVVNFHDVDRAGHYGAGDAYIDGVAELDQLLADFWTRLDQDHPEYAENLLIIVTADHGRHRHDDDDGWHNHGDSCTGCREVPLLLLGPTRAGVELDETIAGIDLAPTAAAWLGVDLPFATGLPVTEAFDALDAPVRTGDVALSASGTRVATQTWLDDRDARSEVRVDGERVSTPGAFGAEAPALVATDDGAFAWFRELDLVPEAGFTPWRARCLAEEGGAWTDIGFPDDEVGALARAALTTRDGTLWAAWPHNPNEAADLGLDNSNGVQVASYTPESGWSEPIAFPMPFVTDTQLVATDRGLVAAVGTSLGDPQERYTRRVRVFPVIPGEPPEFGATTDLALDDLLGGDVRTERPALSVDGPTVRVAMLGITPDGTVAAAATSADGGRTWSAPVLLPDGGDALPTVSPAWDGGFAVWAVLGDDGAELCRATLEDTAASCIPVGSPRLDSFVVEDGVATVSRDAGVGQWERATVAW